MKSRSGRTLVNLLWSGGWDSTFRLLQLVLKEKEVVQPYYLIDSKRESLWNEIKARREIQDRLVSEYPYTKELILPTIYYSVGDIELDEEITRAYNVYRSLKEVDYQYSWIALFCKQFNINDMELCIEARNSNLVLPPPQRLVFSSFLVLVESIFEVVIAEEFKDTVVQTLFRFFRFPIRGYTRKAMEEFAEREGWRDYLYMTWFCHYPVRGRYPCGTCNPCKLVIKKGYGHRIPWYRRLHNWMGLDRVRVRAAKLIRRINPKFHKLIMQVQ
ncbi:MAG: hypothetical protein MUO40_06965 [Anaerolineaceae bacterium]|nr:hypothetical protein [Anaerolineaceae bacterium]